MSVLQVAGKTSNDLAKGISVESDGRQITTKTWETDIVTILESGDITTADAINNLSNAIELSKYGLISLRIHYKIDAPTSIGLFTDLSPTVSTYLRDKDNNWITISLSPTSQATDIIITPEDLPCLSYLKYLKLRIKPSETPENTGFVNIYAIVKR